MYEVLLAIDEDEERALAQARAVTDLPTDPEEVHATLFHVFTGDNTGGASVNQIRSVRRAREHLEDAGVDVTLNESSGDPAAEILEFAEANDVDLVTVSGRQRSPAGKALLGSASQSVLLQSERPVLFVGAGEGIEEE